MATLGGARALGLDDRDRLARDRQARRRDRRRRRRAPRAPAANPYSAIVYAARAATSATSWSTARSSSATAACSPSTSPRSSRTRAAPLTACSRGCPEPAPRRFFPHPPGQPGVWSNQSHAAHARGDDVRFPGGKLEPARDRELLEWMFNQFLYGEVTGIQVGHWLYDAPDLDAAKFLARQSLEEMQHVDNFLRIMTMLGCQPKPAHARGALPGDRHDGRLVGRARRARDGAGRGLRAAGVLRGDRHARSQAVASTSCGAPSSRKSATSSSASSRPRRRSRAGRGCAAACSASPGLDVGRAPARQLHGEASCPPTTPVLSHLPAFLAHAQSCAELRLRRIGVLDRPLAEISRRKRAALVAEAYGGKLARWRRLAGRDAVPPVRPGSGASA